MRPIGGYFELGAGALNFHPVNAILLNSGRNALEYILRARSYTKIYCPYYTCHVLLQPIRKLGIEVEYYHVNHLLEPEFDFKQVGERDVFLYTNYFSLKDAFIVQLATVCRNLIIDNAQAFYSTPVSGIDTFYSPRKYFGLPDGGLLFTAAKLGEELAVDVSIDRMSHLLIRADFGAEAGYTDFLENDRKLDHLEIRQMSNLTRKLLSACPVDTAYQSRKNNFTFLDQHLREINTLHEGLLNAGGVFCYPLLLKQGARYKKELIQYKIFVPTFWPELTSSLPEDSVEFDMVNNLICLPVDQRYDEEDMKRIINIIEEIGK